MKLHTIRSVIREVPERWAAQYRGYGPETDKAAVGRRLAALDLETATPADIERIIGNDSWTSLSCDECRTDVERAVDIGDPHPEDEYEGGGRMLCAQCLNDALVLIWGRAPGGDQGGGER